MNISQEILASAPVATGAYDSTKWNLGSLIRQRTDVSPNFIGPMAVGLTRPFESIGNGYQYPCVISRNSTTDWVFLADASAAGINRKVVLYEYNKTNSTFNYKGFVTLTYPTGATYNHTIKGFLVENHSFTAGTVSVSGNTVSGTGTYWQTTCQVSAQGTVSGSRIGFGSNDPEQITTWYYIDTISAEDTMTIRSNAVGAAQTPSLSISSGTQYVIEDLKIFTATTCSTTSAGGLFIIKGLNYAHFSNTGTTIAGTATNGLSLNLTNVYWFGDAILNTNLTSVGVATTPWEYFATSAPYGSYGWTQQQVHILDQVTTSAKIYRWDFRSTALSGSNTLETQNVTPAVYKTIWSASATTGVGTTTGTVSATAFNVLRGAMVHHGVTNNVPALFWPTTTRVYCVPMGNSYIFNGNPNFLAYSSIENPTGSSTTMPLTSAMANIEYINTIDKFAVITSGATAFRSYVTQFRSDNSQFDQIFLVDDKITQQNTASVDVPAHPTTLSLTYQPASANGLLYLLGTGITNITNIMVAIPVGADWTYALTTNQLAITPAISTPNCDKFKRAYVVRNRSVGGDILGKPSDPFKMYYRITGISDNTGSWTLLSDDNDISSVSSASQIQFAFSFKTISDFCIGTRIFCCGVIYQDISTDTHYRASSSLTDSITKKFAWRFSISFGTTVPALRIRIYDDNTNGLLLDDNTTSPSGTWEKSTDNGTTWTAYNTTDLTNTTTYIRYTPASLADNLTVRQVLTLL